MVSATGGPVAIVRVSGPGAKSIVEALAGLPLEGGRARRAVLRGQGGSPLDDALVVTFVGPQSYTGEDTVEFQVHGNALICERLLKELFRQGARQALPGEFSFRAVRNGRMSVLQAIGVRDLLSAASEAGVTCALGKAQGALDAKAKELRDALLEIAARAELGIDFSDQDAGVFSLESLRDRVRPYIGLLTDLEATYARGSLLQSGVRVVLAGPPNAGKSSLFNALVGQDASIVHERAGTTRDVLERRVKVAEGAVSYSVILADTAGIREAGDAVEREGVSRAQAEMSRADVILWCVPPEARGGALTPPPVKKALLVLTKADLDGQASGEGIPVSARTGEGLSDLEKALARRCADLTESRAAELLLTTEAERQAVQSAIQGLKRASEAVGLEYLASDVKFALQALGPVIGGVGPEEVLGQVFSKFCIGK